MLLKPFRKGAKELTTPTKPEKETFAQWEARKHKERMEREAARAERFAAMSEVHRANMLAAVELMRELPETVAGLIAALGYMPNIKIGVDGISFEGKEKR